MKVSVYYPGGAESAEILRKKIAAVHAEAVLRHIEKLPCPKEQKLRLRDEIAKGFRL